MESQFYGSGAWHLRCVHSAGSKGMMGASRTRCSVDLSFIDVLFVIVGLLWVMMVEGMY